MKTVAIAGASGVVGARALAHLLSDERVHHVYALGRRPLTIEHPKLTARVVDFGDPATLAAALPIAVHVAISALGTTMKRAGSKEAFRAVDERAVLAFAAAARATGAARFVLVSSIGASARARTFYLKVKGETEDALTRLGFASLTVLRPSFIDDEGARTDHRLVERLTLPMARAVFGVVGRTHRYAPVTADTIARALVRLALDDAPEPVRYVESDALHALGGEGAAP